MASIVCEMFSTTAAVAVVSAINLSNSFMNFMLSKLISRRNNLARLSLLKNSAITCCCHKSFKKRPRKKKRFWIKPRRTGLWWRNMKEDRCLEEDWKKNFRMSEADFLSQHNTQYIFYIINVAIEPIIKYCLFFIRKSTLNLLQALVKVRIQILSLNPPPTPTPWLNLTPYTVLLIQCNFVQTILPQYLKRV